MVRATTQTRWNEKVHTRLLNNQKRIQKIKYINGSLNHRKSMQKSKSKNILLNVFKRMQIIKFRDKMARLPVPCMALDKI